jgi:hypothetical protein
MIEFTEILKTAIASIEPEYFRLNIDGGNQIFRERVYCYELYHQLRKIWPSQCKYFLNGEVDKSAHPILSELGINRVTPDLLVHKPGNMVWNYAIIEVKHSMSTNGICKDLKTLDCFVRKASYQRAIYLVYGHEANNSGIKRIKEIANRFDELVPIELWLHSDAGQPARIIETIQRGIVGLDDNPSPAGCAEPQVLPSICERCARCQ